MNSARSLVVFADSASAESVALLGASLEIAARRADVAVVAVCDARRRRPGSHAFAAGRALVSPLVIRLFDPARHVVVRRAMVTPLSGLARRAGVPVLVPPERDVNHPDFVIRLRDELEAPLGLSLLVPQIFHLPLLTVFDRAVNFHPGRLPAYRGLAPTAWEVYRREALGGLSFHLMTPGIDDGPVLVEDMIPAGDVLTVEELEWSKIEQATGLLDNVFDALVAGATGLEQGGEAGYFGRAELRAVRDVQDPSALTWSELELRLRAFGALAIPLAGQTYWVTRLRRLEGSEARRPRHAFTTGDGIRVQPTRFRYLPLPLARLVRHEYLARPRRSRG